MRLKNLKKIRRIEGKEGIFYTPEYITDYICRNTIIPYLSESGKANTVEDLLDEHFGSKINELEEKVRRNQNCRPCLWFWSILK